MSTFSVRMSKAILSVLMTVLVAASYGQVKSGPHRTGTIVGRLIDSASNLPLQSATITLYPTGKSKVLRRTLSDSSGDFALTNIPPGSYTVVIEFVGFRTINVRNVVMTADNDIVNLRRINATHKTAALESVVVTAPPKLIDNKIDRLVFNAERDLTSQT